MAPAIESMEPLPPIAFACPNCAAPLGDVLACPHCGRVYPLKEGIHRFLLPEREQALAAFLAQYRRVREQDGYRSRPAEYYRSLPRVPPDDPQAQNWRVRAETFRHLSEQVLPRLTSTRPQLAVLDLGAGNAWLSNRLGALGHTCVALDWLDDADDGLGATRHYATPITRVQADFDRLPFVPSQFDLLIYNASLHYSPSVETSLGHALKMLRAGGGLAIMDSPTFRSKVAAESMLAEQARRYLLGEASAQTVRPGQGYLLASEIKTVGRRLSLAFRYQPTRGDLGWALRRRLAGLKLRREPAGFGLWLGFKI
jgi:SAM-dependent methyltransferase